MYYGTRKNVLSQTDNSKHHELMLSLWNCLSFSPHRKSKLGAGGAICFPDPFGSLYLFHCNFTRNVATTQLMSFGGAVITETISVFVMKSCTFANNKASLGGAIYSTKACQHPIVVQRCTFRQNVATMSGGTFYLTKTSVNISHSELSENSAHDDASALYFNGASCSLALVDTNISKNKCTALNPQDKTPLAAVVQVISAAHFYAHSVQFHFNKVGGGALRLGGAGKCDIENCSFLKNEGVFGAIDTEEYSLVLTITNTSFIENQHSLGSALSSQTRVILIQNCQFQENDGAVQDPIMILARKSLDLRLCGNLFALALPAERFILLKSVVNDSIPATVYLWNNNIHTLGANGSFPLASSNFEIVNIVNLIEETSMFASGGFCTSALLKNVTFAQKAPDVCQGNDVIILCLLFQHFLCLAWMDVSVITLPKTTPTL